MPIRARGVSLAGKMARAQGVRQAIAAHTRAVNAGQPLSGLTKYCDVWRNHKNRTGPRVTRAEYRQRQQDLKVRWNSGEFLFDIDDDVVALYSLFLSSLYSLFILYQFCILVKLFNFLSLKLLVFLSSYNL